MDHLKLLTRLVAVAILMSCIADDTAAQATRGTPNSVASIGVLDGSPEYVFGRIRSATINGDGRVVVLDSHMNDIRLFDRRGQFVSRAGGPGHGPGELRHPAIVDEDARGRLYVLDMSQMRINRYTAVDGQLRYTDGFRLPVMGRSMCIIGERIHVLGLHEGRTIHAFTLDGRHVISFGEPYHHRNPRMQQVVAQGFLTCAAEQNLVVAVAAVLPEVVAYRPDGTVAWRQQLPNYESTILTERPNGALRMSAGPRGSHNAIGSFIVGNDLLVVQLEFLPSRIDRNAAQMIETRVLNLRTGRHIDSRRDVPWIVDSHGALAVQVQNDPFPLVRILPVEALRLDGGR